MAACDPPGLDEHRRARRRRVFRAASVVFICGALLLGLFVVLEPIGDAAALERSLPRSAVSDPLTGAGPTPVDSPLPGTTPFEQARLHPALRRALQAEGACDSGQAGAGTAEQPTGHNPVPSSPCFLSIIIEWKRSPEITVRAEAIPDRLDRRKQVVAELQAEAQQRSAALNATLADAVAEGTARNVRFFWASPIIALEARPDLIGSLSRRDDVVQIRLDEPIYLEHAPFEAVASSDAVGSLPWNLQMLDVELAQQALGLDGTGVIVASLDTGVDW
jgi:hypothetical protein